MRFGSYDPSEFVTRASVGINLSAVCLWYVSEKVKKWKSDLEGLGGRRTGTREQLSLSFHVITTIAEKKLSDHSD